MYLEKTNSQGKYTCYLLRETYRQDGKVKHRTIANLSGCSAQEIEAIRLALKHKAELTQQSRHCRRVRERGQAFELAIDRAVRGG